MKTLFASWALQVTGLVWSNDDFTVIFAENHSPLRRYVRLGFVVDSMRVSALSKSHLIMTIRILIYS